MTQNPIVILISANSEWGVVKRCMDPAHLEKSPFGEWFNHVIIDRQVVFMHGGWGKIAAAASTQYAIDQWQPDYLLNLGTCGGLHGRVERGDLLLVEQTLIYDIIEQMSDAEAAIKAYSVDLDLSWLRPPYPVAVRRARLLSADRDIVSRDVPELIERFDALAADWESGAIAWTASRNHVRCLILRGVSDLVGVAGGEAYGNHSIFVAGTQEVMTQLLENLPAWLDYCQ